MDVMYQKGNYAAQESFEEKDVVIGRNSLSTIHRGYRIIIPFSNVLWIRFYQDPFRDLARAETE